MILVTVGTEQYPFNRLMHWIDLLLHQGLMQGDVIVQAGNCTVTPKGPKIYKFLKEDKFRDLLQQANFVIAHCGEGTVLLLDTLDKPYILVPRSYEFKEHVDNHQVEMAMALAAADVPVAWSPGDLVRFLKNPRRASVSNLSQTTAAELCQRLHDRFNAPSAYPSASLNITLSSMNL